MDCQKTKPANSNEFILDDDGHRSLVLEDYVHIIARGYIGPIGDIFEQTAMGSYDEIFEVEAGFRKHNAEKVTNALVDFIGYDDEHITVKSQAECMISVDELVEVELNEEVVLIQEFEWFVVPLPGADLSVQCLPRNRDFRRCVLKAVDFPEIAVRRFSKRVMKPRDTQGIAA